VYRLLASKSSGGQLNARFNQLSPAGFSNSQFHSHRISLINLLEKTASFMLNDGRAEDQELSKIDEEQLLDVSDSYPASPPKVE